MNTLFTLLALPFGLVFGSFANVVILRDNERASILTGRSRCPHCRKTLQWYELVPLLSFVVQGGRCRHCRKPISIQYPIVELLGALLTAGAVGYGLAWGIGWLGIADLVIALMIFLIVAGIDVRTQMVPVEYVVVAGLFGALGLELGGVLSSLSLLLGIAVGAGSLAFVRFIWKLFFKKEGMGSGDVWIAGAVGAVAGFPGSGVALIAAIFSGAVVGLLLTALGKVKLQSRLPFGPFLIFGLVVALVWGAAIVRWYTDLSGLT